MAGSRKGPSKRPAPTERERPREAPPAGEEKFRTLFATADDAIFLMTGAVFVDVNPKCIEMFGLDDRSDMVGHTPIEYSPPQQPDGRDSGEKALAYIAAARAGVPQRFAWQHIRKNGEPFDAEVSLNALTIDGEVHLQAIVRDVTARTAAERGLRESEERFRFLAEAASEGIVVSDAGRLVDCNARFAAMVGYVRAELIGRAVTDFVVPEDAPRLAGNIAADLQDPYEVRGLRRDGTVLEVLIQGRVLSYRDRAMRVSVIRDVTESRRSERIQRATYEISAAALGSPSLQELYAAIHRNVSELMPARNLYIALYDPLTDLITFPYHVDEYDGMPEPKHPGKGLTEYVLRNGRALLATPDVHGELERRGEVELIGAPSLDWLGVPLIADGRTIGVLVVQTYTEGIRYGAVELEILQFVSTQVAMAIQRRRAEDAVRESETFHRQAIENAEGVPFRLLFGPSVGTGHYSNVGTGMERLLGVAGPELTEQRFYDLVQEIVPLSPGTPPDAEEARRRYLAGQIPRYRAEVRIRTPDGHEKWVRDSSLPLRDEKSGRIIGALGILFDITEHKHTEEQLRQAQRMEAVGRLAGGVAHDFNNLLTAIGGYSDLLLEELATGDPRRGDVEEIKKAAERAAALTRQLLAFSRRQVLQPKVLDLNGVLGGAEKLLRRLIGEHIRLETRLADGLWAVRADAGQVEQVVMNLAVNAREAMREGGALTLETENVEVGVERRAAEQAAMPPGRYVELRVRDTGVGMDAHTRRHLFEPFFTTREQGRGTGLGLATVYGIVKQSGGFIWVDSTPGAGTTFTIDLPRVDDPVEPVRSAESAAARPSGAEAVLVVEDEPAVRAVVRQALSARGYVVYEAPDGAEAVRMAAEPTTRFDLLLTDVVMPGLGGRALARRLVAERPGLRVLYMSGYTDSGIGEDLVAIPGFELLQKPFGPDELARRVRAVLDAPPPGST